MKDEAERGKEWKHGKDKRKEHLMKYKEEWDHNKDERRQERERRQKERPWDAKSSKHQHHHEKANFWRHQEEKLRRNRHPAEGCRGVSNCADAEGLVPVRLPEFQDLLDVYTSKLEAVPQENKESLKRLTAQFFSGGIFAHDRMLFSEFAEDVADILEDLADEQHDNESLEEEMEEFEKEALLKFAATSA